MEFLLSGN